MSGGQTQLANLHTTKQNHPQLSLCIGKQNETHG